MAAGIHYCRFASQNLNFGISGSRLRLASVRPVYTRGGSNVVRRNGLGGVVCSGTLATKNVLAPSVTDEEESSNRREPTVLLSEASCFPIGRIHTVPFHCPGSRFDIRYTTIAEARGNTIAGDPKPFITVRGCMIVSTDVNVNLQGTRGLAGKFPKDPVKNQKSGDHKLECSNF
jgi:hypothetical protein